MKNLVKTLEYCLGCASKETGRTSKWLLEYIVFPILVISPSLGIEGNGDINTVESRSYIWNDPTDPSRYGPSMGEVIAGETTHLEYLEVLSFAVPAGRKAYQNRIFTDCEQLIIVKAGELTIYINDEVKTLGPGSVAIVLPGDSHQIKNLSGDKVVFYSMNYRSRIPMNVERGKREGGSFVVDFDELEFEHLVKGGRRHYFNRATALTEKFEMHVTTLKEGFISHPAHKHDDEEIILMIHGNAEEMIDGKSYPLSAGDLVFMDSMVLHGIRNTGKGTCMYFAFRWNVNKLVENQ